MSFSQCFFFSIIVIKDSYNPCQSGTREEEGLDPFLTPLSLSPDIIQQFID